MFLRPIVFCFIALFIYTAYELSGFEFSYIFEILPPFWPWAALTSLLVYVYQKSIVLDFHARVTLLSIVSIVTIAFPLSSYTDSRTGPHSYLDGVCEPVCSRDVDTW